MGPTNLNAAPGELSYDYDEQWLEDLSHAEDLAAWEQFVRDNAKSEGERQ